MSINHKELAINYFNATWDLIDKKDRTPEEVVTMIHMAHASRYHWGIVGTPTHFTRGEWQISRVYCLLGMGESALFHAQQALRYCLENDIKDFDLAFAYETLARSYAVCSDDKQKNLYIAMAQTAADDIQDQENKDYLLGELKTIS
ncbi:hypothetical protein [Fusibacter bizertensis]